MRKHTWNQTVIVYFSCSPLSKTTFEVVDFICFYLSKKDQRSEQDAVSGQAAKSKTIDEVTSTTPMSSTIGAGLVSAAAADYASDDVATRNQSNSFLC